MRGYFAIGAEGISKPMNLGALMRSAHAFGANFFFTVEAAFDAHEVKQSDTSDAAKHLPLYTYDSVAELTLPRGCALVGVELTEEAVELGLDEGAHDRQPQARGGVGVEPRHNIRYRNHMAATVAQAEDLRLTIEVEPHAATVFFTSD